MEETDMENDMNGAVIIPGLHDVHMHPLEANSGAGASCKLSNMDDLETIGKKIQESGCAYKGVNPKWALGKCDFFFFFHKWDSDMLLPLNFNFQWERLGMLQTAAHTPMW